MIVPRISRTGRISVLALGVGAALMIGGFFVVELARSGGSNAAAESPASSAVSPDLGLGPQVTAAAPGPRPSAATRVPTNKARSDGEWWIDRNFMDRSSIEVEWSSAGDDATYELFRIPSIGGNPELDPLDASDLLYVGRNQRYLDSAVVPGTFYTYIVVSGANPAMRKWVETLASTDTVPPPKITGLGAQRTAAGVELSWDESSDETEFASYAVSILNGAELTYLGGGADETQTTFTDTRATSNQTTYVVQAVDFHDNRSDPTEVTVG